MSSNKPQNQEPQESNQINELEEKTFAERVDESVDFIVNMMNEGKANPKDVYPPGRYHGD